MTTNDSTSCPAADELRRDEHGRVVRASWLRAGAGAARGGRWLLATDGSEIALRAARQAIDLVRCSPETGIDVVYVHHWLALEAAETELAARGWERSQAVRAALDKAGIPWNLHVLMGEAAPSLVARAKELGCCGIVMGSQGAGAVQNVVLGSVAYKVVHSAGVPVLIVP